MARPLLIQVDDIPKYTAANGNIDHDKYIQFLKIAEDIHIQNYLGTDLLDAIHAQITATGAPTGNYLTLVTNYVKDCEIHWAMVEYLPWAAYTVANKGVFKHSSENSESVEKNEVDYLVEKERDIAEHYTQRLIDYLCNNSTLFPEYTTNSDGDMKPDHNTNFSGWVL